MLRGLTHDRRWMVVEPSGELVTQRERPELARIQTAVGGGVLRLTAPGMPALELPLEPQTEHPFTVTMWTSPVAASLVEAAGDWLSTFLGGLYRLVYMPDSSFRPHPNRPEIPLGFADGNPLLLMSEASVEDLNGRLETPVSMKNFRPNLVVGGCAPYAEDDWDALHLGGLRLERLGACVRCTIVNIDPETSAYRREPLRTLARYRRRGNEVQLGQLYHIVGEPASISCGDALTLWEPGMESCGAA